MCVLLVFMVTGGSADASAGPGCAVAVEAGCDDAATGCEGASGRVGCSRLLAVVGVTGLAGLLCVEESWLPSLVRFFLRRLPIASPRGIKDVLQRGQASRGLWTV